MKKLLLALVCTALFSCQNKEEKLKKDIEPVVLNYYKELAKEDSLIIDSVKILKIDTLTEKKDSVNSYYKLLSRLAKSNKQFKIQADLVKGNLKLMSLTRGLSEVLYQNAKDDFDEEQAKFQEMIRISDLQSKRLNVLDSLIDSKKLDSITPKGYIVISSIKARDSKNIANDFDSLSIVLDLDKRIKIKKEFEN